MRIMLLGSGELGKEFVIAAQRLGQWVVACDSYENAPAMQVAQAFMVFNMLDGDAIQKAVDKFHPDIIVPEIEAIRTEKLYELEKSGIQVVPSANAVNFTMNRQSIRDLASRDLGIKTAKYRYAESLEELKKASNIIGFPCIVKPLMSSSGKGQSKVNSEKELEDAWHYGCEGSRGDIKKLIIEEFIKFDSEITLLTVTQKSGVTLFCPPIGHVQEHGDYRESFQPAEINPKQLEDAKEMSKKITEALGGSGIWGVEFFLSNKDGVYFSELSPRPHDTGMVTMAGTTNLNEFELHCRAILGLPIPEITLERIGASAVILANDKIENNPKEISIYYEGIIDALKEPKTDIRIFNKPSLRPRRRMGITLAYDYKDGKIEDVREKAKKAASFVKVMKKLIN